MARVDLFQPTDMVNLDPFGGFVYDSSSTRIVTSDGFYESYYYGSFTYDGFGNVFGEVNAIDVVRDGVTILGAENFAVDANDFFFYADNGQDDVALELVLAGADDIFGSGGNDVITGGGGSDGLYGGAGDDDFFGGIGNNYLDGGSGIDTAFYRNNSSDYDLFFSGQSLIVDNGIDLNDQLFDVERVDFANATLALDTGAGENAGEAYRMYQAAFARTPDSAGLEYWINVIDAGASLTQVANGFIGSNEFRSVYGANPTNEDFVAQLYFNVLGRPGEQGGVEFWEGQLDGGASRAFVLAGFSESPENIAGVAPTIDNGFYYG